jgi:sugar lactone lactonase YvrE
MKKVVFLCVSILIHSSINSIVYAQTSVLTFGTGGRGDGEFLVARGAAIDSKGNIYVADEVNDRIQKFSRNGVFLGWAGKCTSGPNCDVPNQRSIGLTCTADTCAGLAGGSGNGQFENPFTVTFDVSDQLYVADTGNHRIQVFAPTGEFVRTWGSLGSAPGQFTNPADIAISPSFEIYVADAVNNRVQKFDFLGGFLTQWGSAGSADGEFSTPTGVAVDASGTVYVADALNNRIQKFTLAASCPPGTTQTAAGVCFAGKWGSLGSGNGQFHEPNEVAVDSAGKVYVVDTLNDRIQIFTTGGAFISKSGQFGSGPDDFRAPRGIAVSATDPFPNIYVADSGNSRIRVLGLADADQDGLPDEWETNGLDVNGDGVIDLDLPSLGADPIHKDVFLETDYMEFHLPASPSVANLISAFANAPVSNPDGVDGISLHLDLGDEVPHQNDLDWVGYAAIKQSFFGTPAERSSANAANMLAARRLVYRYAMIAHAGFGSGSAEAPGNDMMVNVGSRSDPSNHLATTAGSFEGTFMHELGHNLGLLHGGGDEINYKPNYLSVMNYAFMGDWLNFFVAGYQRPLDFSRSILPVLDENNLNETDGVGATTPPGLYTYYHPTTDPTVASVISLTGVPIDWNNNGTTNDTGVVANVNCSPFGCDAPGQKVVGYDDWSALQFSFRTGPFLNAIIPPVGPPELTVEEINASMTVTVPIDIKPGTFPNAINQGSNGVVPVAILSTPSFNAQTVDAATVTLASAPVRLTAKSKLLSSFQDVNGDGRLDLVVQVETSALQLSAADVQAVLEGRTFTGLLIHGVDSIRVVP